MAIATTPVLPQSGSALSDTPRLAALKASALMDSLPEEAYDRAVRLATRIIGAPVGLVSLVDNTRQFFKAQCGLPEPVATDRQTPLSQSFCQHVVTTRAPLVVRDAREHPLVANNDAIDALGVIAYLGVPIRDPAGHILGSFCVIDDKPRDWSPEHLSTLEDLVSMVESEIALRQTARDRQLVARELNHRVKNLFTVVGGMISLSARDCDTPRALAEVLQARLQALSTAHNLIMPAVEGTDDTRSEVALQTLVSMLIEPHLHFASDHMTIDGPTLTVGAAATTSLALVLHELATNAAKYGALSVPDGWLEICWTTQDGQLVLDWTENGVAPPASGLPRATGFGTRLIRASVEGQLRGNIDSTWGASGMHHRITLPLDALAG